jgi:antitoxin CptB
MAELPAADVRRLRWQCRRGMLELDLVLRRFLDVAYHDLDQADRARFSVLLETQDQELHDWIMGYSTPADPYMRALVDRIRTIGG